MRERADEQHQAQSVAQSTEGESAEHARERHQQVVTEDPREHRIGRASNRALERRDAQDIAVTHRTRQIVIERPERTRHKHTGARQKLKSSRTAVE